MKFIALTGPDASGKDLQIDRLNTELQRRKLRTQVLSIHSSMKEFAAKVDPRSVNQILEVFLIDFDPHARTLFLQALLKNALSKISQDSDVVLFNGYWYKYAASEISYGVSSNDWIECSESSFLKPDLLLQLSLPISSCLLRRSHWSPYESGQAKYVDKTRSVQDSSLLSVFQNSMHKNLKQVLEPLDRKVINAENSEDIVTQSLMAEIEPLL